MKNFFLLFNNSIKFEKLNFDDNGVYKYLNILTDKAAELYSLVNTKNIYRPTTQKDESNC